MPAYYKFTQSLGKLWPDSPRFENYLYQSSQQSPHLDNLDMLRGAAALLVLSGHLRSFLFENYDFLSHKNLTTIIFYFFTGLGHQAVIVFFALSGYLVGGRALEDILTQRFSWPQYLLRRLTRLWIVIIPALLLTLLLDDIGSGQTAGLGYDGRYYDIYTSGPPASDGIDHSLLTFLGNIAFLQTIALPTYGSNGPMWSLANEFWYYITFPLAVWVFLSRSAPLVRISALCMLALIVAALPITVLSGGVTWVAGAISAWCVRRQTITKLVTHPLTRVAAMILIVATLVLTKARLNLVGDLGLGFVVAATLPIFATLPSPGRLYSVLARALSALSYTLYLTHFPFLTLAVLVEFAPDRLPPSVVGAERYAALLLMALIWATIVWWCFERNTNRVYFLISKTLLK
jgi:peptidoglycan/LPS O-acetylase OafA/YrhL